MRTTGRGGTRRHDGREAMAKKHSIAATGIAAGLDRASPSCSVPSAAHLGRRAGPAHPRQRRRVRQHRRRGANSGLQLVAGGMGGGAAVTYLKFDVGAPAGGSQAGARRGAPDQAGRRAAAGTRAEPGAGDRVAGGHARPSTTRRGWVRSIAERPARRGRRSVRFDVSKAIEAGDVRVRGDRPPAAGWPTSSTRTADARRRRVRAVAGGCPGRTRCAWLPRRRCPASRTCPTCRDPRPSLPPTCPTCRGCRRTRRSRCPAAEAARPARRCPTSRTCRASRRRPAGPRRRRPTPSTSADADADDRPTTPSPSPTRRRRRHRRRPTRPAVADAVRLAVPVADAEPTSPTAVAHAERPTPSRRSPTPTDPGPDPRLRDRREARTHLRGALGCRAGRAHRPPRDQALAEFERDTGQTQAIYHAYHRGTELFPTATEMQLARDPANPRLLFLNWKPTGASWAEIAARRRGHRRLSGPAGRAHPRRRSTSRSSSPCTTSRRTTSSERLRLRDDRRRTTARCSGTSSTGCAPTASRTWSR